MMTNLGNKILPIQRPAVGFTLGGCSYTGQLGATVAQLAQKLFTNLRVVVQLQIGHKVSLDKTLKPVRGASNMLHVPKNFSERISIY